MRTIKFRGKCAKDSRYAGEWAYGSCVQCEKSDDVLITAAINDRCSCTYHVDPDTVGQFTGFFLDGIEIYEGDILECCYDRDVKKGVVVYYQGSFGLTKGDPYESFEDMHRFFYGSESGYKVVGNIHDNPELLKGGEE